MSFQRKIKEALLALRIERTYSKQKILELGAMLEHIQSMRDLLEQQGKCRCTALEECGKKMFERQCTTGLS